MTQLTSMIEELTQQEKTVVGIGASMAMMSSQYDEVLKNMKTQEDAIGEIAKKMHKMESVISKQDLKIGELKATVDSIEQYSRRNNVKIHGVQKRENENLLNGIPWIGTKLNCQCQLPMTKRSIDWASVKEKSHLSSLGLRTAL
ncbi:unnamed protein product [Ixodes persulcatus]